MPTQKPLVIILLGPTASGKTELGIKIAKDLNLGIHNIDSRQLYQGMDIGTAKPTKQQQEEINRLYSWDSRKNEWINFLKKINN